MKTKHLGIILVVFFGSINVLRAQNAEIYYTLINKAESEFVNGDLDSSLYFYNKALNDFNFPFYKHIKQAAIVAHYNEKKNLLKKLLVKCIERGMNKDELCFFTTRNQTNKVILDVSTNFNIYKKVYSQSIDTFLFKKYLEFDYFDEYFLIKKYKRVEENRDEIRKIQGRALLKYIELIKNYGFPSEKNVGLDFYLYESGCTWEECREENLENSFKLSPNINNPIFISEERGIRRGENTRPGNRFIWHYNHDTLIDKEYLQLMNLAFQNLEMSPSNLIYYFETAEGEKYKDFFYTYESKYFLDGLDRFGLEKEIENIIDKNRKKYFIRSIKMEKKIFEKLYELEFFKKPKKINKKSRRKIEYAYYAFLYYY